MLVCEKYGKGGSLAQYNFRSTTEKYISDVSVFDQNCINQVFSSHFCKAVILVTIHNHRQSSFYLSTRCNQNQTFISSRRLLTNWRIYSAIKKSQLFIKIYIVIYNKANKKQKFYYLEHKFRIFKSCIGFICLYLTFRSQI